MATLQSFETVIIWSAHGKQQNKNVDRMYGKLWWKTLWMQSHRKIHCKLSPCFPHEVNNFSFIPASFSRFSSPLYHADCLLCCVFAKQIFCLCWLCKLCWRCPLPCRAMFTKIFIHWWIIHTRTQGCDEIRFFSRDFTLVQCIVTKCRSVTL